ncbi:MAG: hypothetical protein IPK74_01465 [Deltaproteobacteria bacterium]|nr:hypothetical protein [Deltaproteobacteria bacterium]
MVIFAHAKIEVESAWRPAVVRARHSQFMRNLNVIVSRCFAQILATGSLAAIVGGVGEGTDFTADWVSQQERAGNLRQVVRLWLTSAIQYVVGGPTFDLGRRYAYFSDDVIRALIV